MYLVHYFSKHLALVYHTVKGRFRIDIKLLAFFLLEVLNFALRVHGKKIKIK
jgi:hypothetical protein